jgi:hypothetical protein
MPQPRLAPTQIGTTRRTPVARVSSGPTTTADDKEQLFIAGHGHVTDNPDIRATATSAANYEPADHYILMEFLLGEIRCNAYGDVELPATSRWNAPNTRGSAKRAGDVCTRSAFLTTRGSVP